MTPYKLQLVQQLKDTDKPARRDFCIAMQQKMEDDGFDDRLVFSDEAAFHVNGKVNKHNTRIWGTEIPHELLEHQRDSPKVTVFCACRRKLSTDYSSLKERQSMVRCTSTYWKTG